MEIITANAITVLKDLISICRESENKYREAEENTSDNTLQNIFKQYADQRNYFIREFENELHKYINETQIENDKEFDWMDVRTKTETGEKGSPLAECKAKEEATLFHFSEAIKMDIPGDTKSLVARHYNAVRDANEKLKEIIIGKNEKG